MGKGGEKAEGPKGWERTLGEIREMRKERLAPVDTMGCAMLGSKSCAPKEFRFQTLVALMLSSQTKDEVTGAAVARLKTVPLTVEGILGAEEETLAKLICPVGFYRKKASSLRRVAAILKEEHDSDIPNTLEGLTSLPGVGPKMAYLALQNAWGLNEGIGVDVHVHRISNRLGWLRTKSPEETRRSLEEWLPRETWAEINPLFVGFGQTVCLPVKPRCADCRLSQICPSSSARPASVAPPPKRRKPAAQT